MKLCIDIGNTHVFGGVFDQTDLRFRFRYPTSQATTSDQFGLFLKGVLRENQCDPNAIDAIGISSVVPSLDYSIIAACIKYLGITPTQLKPGIKTGLRIEVKNPVELGADRIANAVAALAQFPNKHLLILDFGTATTLCAINKKGAYLGGSIMPGMKISMQALNDNAAKLSPVDILKPTKALGQTTISNIQSGLYYGQLGALRELITRISQEAFPDEKPVVLATGGYAHLFAEENLYDVHLQDLVLHGMRLILERN
ncbi:MAG: type III pantothenate kinase 2 [marine bacterium B5-7]|nr:MAG: type III pantothenate kinase 2 [marine bacterium B5-7]